MHYSMLLQLLPWHFMIIKGLMGLVLESTTNILYLTISDDRFYEYLDHSSQTTRINLYRLLKCTQYPFYLDYRDRQLSQREAHELVKYYANDRHYQPTLLPFELISVNLDLAEILMDVKEERKSPNQLNRLKFDSLLITTSTRLISNDYLKLLLEPYLSSFELFEDWGMMDLVLYMFNPQYSSDRMNMFHLYTGEQKLLMGDPSLAKIGAICSLMEDERGGTSLLKRFDLNKHIDMHEDIKDLLDWRDDGVSYYNLLERIKTISKGTSEIVFWHVKLLLFTINMRLYKDDDTGKNAHLLPDNVKERFVKLLKELFEAYEPKKIPRFLVHSIFNVINRLRIGNRLAKLKSIEHVVKFQSLICEKVQNPFGTLEKHIICWRRTLRASKIAPSTIPTGLLNSVDLIRWWADYDRLGDVLVFNLTRPIILYEEGVIPLTFLSMTSLLEMLTKILFTSSVDFFYNMNTIWCRAMARTIASNLLYQGQLGFKPYLELVDVFEYPLAQNSFRPVWKIAVCLADVDFQALIPKQLILDELYIDK